MIKLNDILLCLPECFLLLSSLFMLLLGVFLKQTQRQWVHILTKITFFSVAALLILSPRTGLAFNGLFINDSFAVIFKTIIAVGGLIVFIISEKSLKHEDIRQFEYPILLTLATLGMFLMISANDLISLFVGLELQSLSLYIITTVRRDDSLASEAGMKYFVLGALSTGLLLYGCSLIYGFSGTTNFTQLAQTFGKLTTISLGAYVGFGFILAGLIFKISAVPFHMWTPDVYQGSPTGITTFLASTPKVAAFGLLTRVLASPFYQLWEGWEMLLSIIAVASMVWGAFAALNQSNIKRLIAYSSINNMGYALIGLVVMTEQGIRASVVYILLYLAMIIGVFTCLMNMSRRGYDVEKIEELKGLIKIYPGTAFALAFLLFSMAGIPPLAGFLGKLYIFQAAVASEYYTLAIIGVLTSVVAAAYYLYVIKVMIMDTPDAATLKQFSHYRRDPVISLVLVGTVAGLIWFFVIPGPVIRLATQAASSLFQGLS